MADVLSDADVGIGGPPAGALSDADVGLGPPAKEAEPTFGQHMTRAVTDIPTEIGGAFMESGRSAAENLNPWSEKRRASIKRQSEGSFGDSLGESWQQFKDVGKGIAAIPGMVMSPFTGTARSGIGHPYAAITGMPYDQAKEAVDTAMMGLSPARGGIGSVRAPAPPPPPAATGPLGVTLSEGQSTGALPAIRTEQAALRGQKGPAAETHAKDFAEQQGAQVADATEGVSRSLDPFGARVAETPAEAGQIVSESVRGAAASRKAGVKQAYKEAGDLGGEIHAGALENIGQKIKGELTLRDEPVIVDMNTPNASKMIDDVDNTIARLSIPNKADPFGAPNPENVVGVNLKGIDVIRKRLSTFRKDAWNSGNASDGRAASAIMDAFDKRIDNSVNSGLFSGDKRAIQAWNDARAAHADYAGTFTAGKGDSVGRVVEKITGKGNNPAAIPNDVADFMYGATGTNASTLNVGVANRIKKIMGEQSPEWSAVKQGLFSRITESAPGVSDFGPGKIAQRGNRFLNGEGKELAEAIFKPHERQLLQAYFDMQRKLEVPASGVNRSETSTFVVPVLQKISTSIAALAGAALGHVLAPGAYGAGELIGGTILGKGTSTVTNAVQARKIAKQMPLVADAMAKWQRQARLVNQPGHPSLALETGNLAAALKPLGIDLAPMLKADEKDQQAPNQKETRVQNGYKYQQDPSGKWIAVERVQ